MVDQELQEKCTAHRTNQRRKRKGKKGRKYI